MDVIKAVAGSRSARPLLTWVLAVLVYLVFPLPRWWVFVLVVGLGVALTVTIRRAVEALDDDDDVPLGAGPDWQPATPTYYQSGGAYPKYQVPYPPIDQTPHPYGHAGSLVVAYDPGALLSAIVAVLAVEGIPTDAAPGLPAVAQLLAKLGIRPHPGIPAPTARGLTSALHPGPERRARVMPPELLASVVRVVLTHDDVLPEHITTDTADMLTAQSATVLMALFVQPGGNGSLDSWPAIAVLIDAAPLPVPYEPQPGPYSQW